MFTPAPLENFSEDKLNLKPFADELTNIIMSPLPHPTNKYSKVIFLNSGWGTGKTSFINMWTKELETESKFICLKYNAWENDDSHDALIPILCRFQQLIDENTGKGKQLMKCLLTIIATFGSEAIRVASQYFVGEKTVLGIERAYRRYKNDKYPNRIFEMYRDRQQNKGLFEKFVDELLGKANYLLICIDELDRCRPTFAIETLEVVKHFFDLEHVIFVFSLDMDQLQKSIKILYGEIDSIRYLQRFYDYIIPLPAPFTLDNFLKDRFVQSSDEIDILSSLAKRFSIPLRLLNQICDAYCRLRESILTKNTHDYRQEIKLKIYLPFIALKYSNHEVYQSLLQKGSSTELGREILGFLKNSYWSGMYTEENANLSHPDSIEDMRKWNDMTSLFSLFDEHSRDEPIYKLIDKNIESSLLKAKEMEIT